MQAIHDDQYSNWFYTDVMARGKYPAYMNRYFDACDIEIQMEPGDEELIARNTVDFLAFSILLFPGIHLRSGMGEDCG